MASVAVAPEPASRPLRGARWYVCGLLFLVTAINYVDRVSLGAMNERVLKPALGWDDAEFAWINFSFALSYGIMFAFAGRVLDRIGVRAGLALGVLVWSVAAMGHALAGSVLGFVIARFLLGLGEATNFPAAIKAVAEWFPRRERSFATGIFNTGTNVGAMLQGAIAAMAVHFGWQSAFILIGALGFLWLVPWLRFYRSPEDHPRLSAEELSLIRSEPEPPAAALAIPWPSILRYREAWAFCIGKLLTDPVWWFYLTWLPSYLSRSRNVSLAQAAGALAVVYLCADAGSILGGWLPGYLQRRGWDPSKARLTTMLVFAGLMPLSILVISADSLAGAVACISVATTCHQAWSANMFTVASDAFPKRAVGSIVGFGAMAGAVGGMFMQLIAGGTLQWLGSFTPLFVVAGVLHPLSWLIIRALTGREIRQVDLGRGLRTAFSAPLLWGGSLLAVAGATGAWLAWRNWDAIVAATNRSPATAALGVAGPSLVALLGLALAYASRTQRPVAAS
ncbi:MAG TPA: MFS transporter [Vicinamibacteria bacterium]|nr:MFS transporter [Vicinamibacteria bacterium]